jgi:hypothetical protein
VQGVGSEVRRADRFEFAEEADDLVEVLRFDVRHRQRQMSFEPFPDPLARRKVAVWRDHRLDRVHRRFVHVLQRLVSRTVSRSLNREDDRRFPISDDPAVVNGERRPAGRNIVQPCNQFCLGHRRREEPFDRRVRHELPGYAQSILPLQQLVDLHLRPAHLRRRSEVVPVANVVHTAPLPDPSTDRTMLSIPRQARINAFPSPRNAVPLPHPTGRAATVNPAADSHRSGNR